jgi:hypothetical protein
MSRRVAVLGISLLVLTACAGEGAGGEPAAAPASASGEPSAAFAAQAERVAAAWRDSTARDAWGKGFMPLQPLTVPPANAAFNEATKLAFGAGWYTLATGMPRERGGRTGTIRYADGATDTVPLVTLAEAYGALDQGDPPRCAGPSVPPPADAPAVQDPTVPDMRVSDGPAGDTSVSDGASKPCLALTVTATELGTATVLTSRGRAEVPAWLFTVRELKGQVARVAVAPSAVTVVPEINIADPPAAPVLVSAQDLTGVTGNRLAYRLGVGACDEDIRPLAYETDEVVVVGGSVVRADGVCTDQLVLHPVSVELDQPPGARPVLDNLTGRILTLTPAA